VWDPQGLYGDPMLRAFELRGDLYVPMQSLVFPSVGLGMKLWDGIYEGLGNVWLRWTLPDGSLVATGAERTKVEHPRAETERQRAETEHERAETERHRDRRSRIHRSNGPPRPRSKLRIAETVVCAVLRIPPLLSARKTSVPPNGTRASGTPTAMPFDVARPLVAMLPVLVTRRAGSNTRVPYPRGTRC
jgi:hypothetical protein